MIYDIFYVSKKNVDADRWKNFQDRFPSAQRIENVKSFDDIRKKSFTKFFWVVWDDLIIVDDFLFDYRVEKWDEQYIHVWLNGEHRDGVCLFPKLASVTQKEFDHRFYINKKEIDVVASQPCPYDIIFISYDESYADENFNRLQSRFSRAKRVHGVKGIHKAHIAAAELASTDMFWVVDADAFIVEDFNFTVDYIPYYDVGNREQHLKTVYVWTSKNPVNDLEYGYGGVKLFPREMARNIDPTTTDMTTSISENFKIVPVISNITMFNTDEFSTWRSAFRECVKLVSKVIDRNHQEETLERLKVWCKVGLDRPYGRYAIGGALSGYFYGKINIGNDPALRKINDFEWLHTKFLEYKEKYVNGRNKDKEIYPDNE